MFTGKYVFYILSDTGRYVFYILSQVDILYTSARNKRIWDIDHIKIRRQLIAYLRTICWLIFCANFHMIDLKLCNSASATVRANNLMSFWTWLQFDYL